MSRRNQRSWNFFRDTMYECPYCKKLIQDSDAAYYHKMYCNMNPNSEKAMRDLVGTVWTSTSYLNYYVYIQEQLNEEKLLAYNIEYSKTDDLRFRIEIDYSEVTPTTLRSYFVPAQFEKVKEIRDKIRFLIDKLV